MAEATSRTQLGLKLGDTFLGGRVAKVHADGNYGWVEDQPAPLTFDILQDIRVGVQSGGTNAGSSVTIEFLDKEGNTYPNSDWTVETTLTGLQTWTSGDGTPFLVFSARTHNGTVALGRNRTGTLIFKYVGTSPNGLSGVNYSGANGGNDNGTIAVNFANTNFSHDFPNKESVTVVDWTIDLDINPDDIAEYVQGETDLKQGALRKEIGPPIRIFGRIVDDATADATNLPSANWQEVSAAATEALTIIDSNTAGGTAFGLYRKPHAKRYEVIGNTNLTMVFPTDGGANEDSHAEVYNKSTGEITIEGQVVPAGGMATIIADAGIDGPFVWVGNVPGTADIHYLDSADPLWYNRQNFPVGRLITIITDSGARQLTIGNNQGLDGLRVYAADGAVTETVRPELESATNSVTLESNSVYQAWRDADQVLHVKIAPTPTSSKWQYSTDGMNAVDGDRIIVAPNHTINLTDVTDLASIEFAPSTGNWSDIQAGTGMFSPDAAWDFGLNQQLPFGSDVLRAVSNLGNTNWLLFTGGEDVPSQDQRYETVALLPAIATVNPGAMGVVYNDPTPANNRTYIARTDGVTATVAVAWV